MKTKFFTLAIAILGFTSASFAQSTATNATANASATLLTPLSITKSVDLNFGNIASSNETGTAILSTAGVVTRTGGVAVLTGIQATAAKFTVTGDAAQKFTMTAPASIGLSSGTGDPLNLVLEYKTDLGATLTAPSATGVVLTGGSRDIFVGGTLTVPANTVAGTYTNTTDLKITVAYE